MSANYQANVQSGKAKAQSAADQVLNHPVVKQAQDRAHYYVSQLDKEVSLDQSLFFSPRLKSCAMHRTAVQVSGDESR